MENSPIPSTNRPWVIAAALFWLLLALFLYYWVHKPVTPDFVRAFGGAVIDVVSVALIVAVAGGLGRYILNKFCPTWSTALSQAEQLGGEALLGLGLLSILIFFVGLVWLHFISMLLLFLVIIAIIRDSFTSWNYHTLLWLHISGSGPYSRTRWENGLLLFILFSLTLGLIMALAPPIKFDSLTYHLLGPKLWVENGRFESLPGNHFFGFPQLIHTLFAGEMALTFGRLTGAAVIHWAFGGLSLMVVGGYGTRKFSPHVGLLAVAILLAAPSIWLQLGWPYVDLPPIGFAMMTFIALEQWRERNFDTRWLMIAATFVGLAMSVKYTLICMGFAAGFYILGYSKGTRWLRDGLIMIGVASLVLAPWLFRNLLFYDNPIYPFGPATGEWDSLMNEWYSGADGALIRTLPGLYWTIPITSTVFGVEGGGNFASTIGPFFLLLIPLLALSWRKLDAAWKKSIEGMAAIISGIFLCWMVAAAVSGYGAQTRLWYAMFPMLALLAAIGFDGLRLLPRKPVDIRFVIQAVVALIFIFTAIDYVRGVRIRDGHIEGTTAISHFLESRSLDYLMGVIDEDDYLNDALGWHIEAMRQVNKLPDDSKVLFLWETRSLYCDEPRLECIEDSILTHWWHDRRTVGIDSEEGAGIDFAMPEAILANWRKQGITHILVFEAGRDFEFEDNPRITAEDKTEWEKVPPLLKVVWQKEEEYSLYTLPD